MYRKILILILCVLTLNYSCHRSSSQRNLRTLPEPPQYFSEGKAEDQGSVMPVANSKNEHIKIAFLAMEPNPCWTPVKAGVMEAQELLKEFNTEVDWKVAGDRHTAEVFGTAF